MTKDLEKRKRIMQRSIRLGHCICDAAKPCPCDLFKEKDICLCAGERLEVPSGPVALTQLVEKAGCASKIDQAFLKAALSDLPTLEDPRVLVGMPAGDDAGVYALDEATALVQTVDVFTPSVDDPYQFGQVAAANSLSDVYAMGGRPLTALSIVGFPVRKLADSVLREILRGGIDKMAEAGVPVIGGHSIDDDQIKAGFAVTGLIDKNRVTTNAGARAGDVLILTKPLGTGIVAFAKQIGRAREESLAAAVRSMTTLNRSAAGEMERHGVHACTDVTGFGLMGHLSEMALRSGVDVEIRWDDLPWFPHVLQYAAEGILPGGIERNKESCGSRVYAGEEVGEVMLDMCFDAQTSGGLLMAVAPETAVRLLKSLHDAGVEDACIIGKVRQKGEGRVYIETSGKRRLPMTTKAPESTPATQTTACCSPDATSACCSEGAAPSAEAGTEGLYQQFLDAAGRPGNLDAFTKQAIQIALSVATRCEPCLKAHMQKARQGGFTPAEMDEAAMLGVAFGGSPSLVMYTRVRNSK
ncbi:MAG: selenide, water dikinase SelD [Acidobacteria bacterium]|jgi:selenide,water dikinase|nr:selenide, water dikinase SelD [Acidobacteriota bacterium]